MKIHQTQLRIDQFLQRFDTKKIYTTIIIQSKSNNLNKKKEQMNWPPRARDDVIEFKNEQ